MRERLLLVFHEFYDILLIQDKLIIIAVLSAGPADLSPEGIADIVFGKGDQRDPVDPLSAKSIHAVAYHLPSDPLSAEFTGYTYMIEAPLPSVASAQDRTDDLLAADSDDACRGISI